MLTLKLPVLRESRILQVGAVDFHLSTVLIQHRKFESPRFCQLRYRLNNQLFFRQKEQRERTGGKRHDRHLQELTCSVLPIADLKLNEHSRRESEENSLCSLSYEIRDVLEATFWPEKIFSSVSRLTSGLKLSWRLSAVAAVNATLLFHSAFLHPEYAEASQLGELRQGVTILERAIEGLNKLRLDPEAGVQVLDKALTVVSGSTIVDPEVLNREVESLLNGETDIREELKKTTESFVQGTWSNLLDVVTNFNPVTWSESAGTSLQGFVEAGFERFAAFEISALVTLGERWLILTPLVVLPMAWQMRRTQIKADERERQRQVEAEELLADSQLRGERVRRELERIELRTVLLDAITSLGEMALQPPRTTNELGLIRRRIQDILTKLRELNPIEDALIIIPEVASNSSVAVDSVAPMAQVPTTPTVDGDWRLRYVSAPPEVSGDEDFPRIPGISLHNIRQKVWQASALNSAIANDSSAPLSARNTAEVRFGPIGVLEVAVQGRWEILENGQTASVSFDSFSARPVEVLGSKLTSELPQLSLTIPRSFQQTAEWKVVYLDSHLRVNRGRRGQLFVFSKVD